MAKYLVTGSDGSQVCAMESTDVGLVRLAIRAEAVLMSTDTAGEIRSLLAIVIADAQGCAR